MKNPNLCQRPFCREPYTKTVSGYDPRFGGRSWILRVCDFHAQYYEEARKEEIGHTHRGEVP